MRFFSACASALTILVAHVSLAQEKTSLAAPVEETAPIVRVALSKQAAAFLTEGRVRRLLELELPDITHLAEESTGPLDENAVHLYIDLPEPSVVTIQVQAPQRKVETRRVDVAGLAWDVAARVTAIAASESVRSELAPIYHRPTKPREPTDAELAAAFRRTPSISVSGAMNGVILPSVAGLGGSRLTVGFHQRFFSEELSLAALGGDGPAGQLRVIDVGVGLQHRVYFTSRVRADLGAVFALSHAMLLQPDPADDESGFTTRVAAHLALDVRLVDHAWLSIQLEPGGVLLDAPKGVQGAWLGANVGLAFDSFLPASTPEVRTNP